MQNAIDAIREAPCDHNEIQLQVWAAKGVADVVVRDTGAGVSDAATERMFEPFFTTKSHGLGMGLAISRSSLEEHGGRIWVKRRADGSRGTTVRFSLPLQPPKTAREKRAT
jgi:C4-dicarboxylate-specific signal transduction histidine kinase